jgi:hypothetical protein
MYEQFTFRQACDAIGYDGPNPKRNRSYEFIFPAQLNEHLQSDEQRRLAFYGDNLAQDVGRMLYENSPNAFKNNARAQIDAVNRSIANEHGVLFQSRYEQLEPQPPVALFRAFGRKIEEQMTATIREAIYNGVGALKSDVCVTLIRHWVDSERNGIVCCVTDSGVGFDIAEWIEGSREVAIKAQEMIMGRLVAWSKERFLRPLCNEDHVGHQLKDAKRGTGKQLALSHSAVRCSHELSQTGGCCRFIAVHSAREFRENFEANFDQSVRPGKWEACYQPAFKAS